MKQYRIRPGSKPTVKLNKAGVPREAFEGLRLDDFREWIRGLPCCIAGKVGASGAKHGCWHPEKISDAAHVDSKARGTGDAGNLTPLCRRAHQDQHNYGMKSFQREWNVNLREIAGALWLEYEAQNGAPKL